MAIKIDPSIKEEIIDIIVADIVLIFAFALTLDGGIFYISSFATWFSNLIFFIPMVAIGVTLSFVLHELMHRFVAIHYGAIAGFKSSKMGLIITMLTGAFGFLLGIPGATMIYAHNFSKRENGIVSIAGPLTNFLVFAIFLMLFIVLKPAQKSYLFDIISFTLFISILLAFFNMLPIPPLDGSKVLAWNKYIYIVTMGIIFGLMLFFSILPLIDILYMVAIAIFFSFFYRNIIF
ncbi:MAG: site-2 protease family protein [Candidatus Micrarchaeia archaeon]